MTLNTYYLTRFLWVRNLKAAHLGWFWLRVSHEVAIKMLVGAVIIRRFDWDGGCASGSLMLMAW